MVHRSCQRASTAQENSSAQRFPREKPFQCQQFSPKAEFPSFWSWTSRHMGWGHHSKLIWRTQKIYEGKDHDVRLRTVAFKRSFQCSYLRTKIITQPCVISPTSRVTANQACGDQGARLTQVHIATRLREQWWNSLKPLNHETVCQMESLRDYHPNTKSNHDSTPVNDTHSMSVQRNGSRSLRTETSDLGELYWLPWSGRHIEVQKDIPDARSPQDSSKAVSRKVLTKLMTVELKVMAPYYLPSLPTLEYALSK